MTGKQAVFAAMLLDVDQWQVACLLYVPIHDGPSVSLLDFVESQEHQLPVWERSHGVLSK